MLWSGFIRNTVSGCRLMQTGCTVVMYQPVGVILKARDKRELIGLVKANHKFILVI